jgi:hypothetical protein
VEVHSPFVGRYLFIPLLTGNLSKFATILALPMCRKTPTDVSFLH